VRPLPRPSDCAAGGDQGSADEQATGAAIDWRVPRVLRPDGHVCLVISDSIDGRHPRAVVMPPITWGQCRVLRCWVVGDLGDRLCVEHWDRGIDKKIKDDKLSAVL
jgi:hypothetical protein